MSFGWWTFLDTHGETVAGEKPSNIVVLDALKPVRLAPTTMPRSKALNLLNGTQSMTHLSQGLKILL
jgi:hypothetical protein